MIGAVALYASILLWGILCGAIVYEHLAIIPVWASNPPESLAMWTGPYPVKSAHFWPFIHPVIIVAFLASIALNWDNEARDLVALAGAGYVLAVIVPTAIWFVPELLRLINPESGFPAEQWRRRAKRWERLSLARGVIVLALIVPLLIAFDVRG